MDSENEQAARKSVIRQRVRSLRGSLSSGERHEADERICDVLWRMDLLQECHVVIGYRSHRGEANIDRLLEHLLQSGKTLFAPRVVSPTELDLCPVRNLQADFSAGAFGIAEPNTSADLAPVEGVILVPGVAFDENGVRLGSGRGYYDRLLPRLGLGVISIGVAYECQIVSDLPFDPWDQLVDCVVTDVGILRRNF